MRALIVVDMQNDFITGSLAVKGAERLLKDIPAYLDKEPYEYIFLTKDWHPRDHVSFASANGVKDFASDGTNTFWPNHCIAGTQGAEFPMEMSEILKYSHAIIHKGYGPCESYSAFVDSTGLDSGFIHMIAGLKIQEVDLCGIAFDFCVKETALSIEVQANKAKVHSPIVRILKNLTVSVNPNNDIAIANYLGRRGILVE